MSNLIQLQLDAEGNEIPVDGSATGIQTKAEAEDNTAGMGAQINENQKYDGRLQVGQQGADDAAADAAQAKVDLFVQELDRLQSVSSAGRTVPDKTLENLQHELNDTAMAYLRSGGDINDEVMVGLRARVDDISRSLRHNKR